MSIVSAALSNIRWGHLQWSRAILSACVCIALLVNFEAGAMGRNGREMTAGGLIELHYRSG